jgi:hypothetical protein
VCFFIYPSPSPSPPLVTRCYARGQRQFNSAPSTSSDIVLCCSIFRAVYGKSANEDDRRYSSPTAGLSQPSCIPRLRPEFFSSHFFQAFLTQRTYHAQLLTFCFFINKRVFATLVIRRFVHLRSVYLNSYRFPLAQARSSTPLNSLGDFMKLKRETWKH